MNFEPGDKIRFAEEKQAYTIQACDKRFLICTKPMNAMKTFLYTIVDLKERVRNRDNMIFGAKYDYSNPKEAMLGIVDLNTPTDTMLQNGKWIAIGWELELSHRGRLDLNIVKYEKSQL